MKYDSENSQTMLVFSVYIYGFGISNNFAVERGIYL